MNNKTHEAKTVIAQELDALSLEYKRDYGTARENIDVSNLLNHPYTQSIVCVFGPGFSEKITDLPVVKISVLPNDRSNP